MLHTKDFCSRSAVPVSCSDCRFKTMTVYREVMRQSPERVTSCRKKIISTPAGRQVLRQDHVPDTVFTIYDGWLYRYRQLPNGRQQVMNFVIPGDTLTFQSLFLPGQKLSYGVKAITDVQMCSFDAADFRAMMSADPAFMAPFHADLAGYLEAITLRICNLGQLNARARMAHMMADLYKRHLKRGLIVDDGFDFPVTQEIIGSKLGLTKGYVNRTIAGLKAEDLLEISEGRARIHDIKALQAIAEDA